ncbi:MAG: cell division protein FtsA [Chloroherpetonaceae bacterium]|nr:cell division protein FtsA [Chloroherpetonaceae bacterium]
MKDKIVVGLDIGTTKICVVVAKKDEFGKIQILGVGKAKSEGVSRAAVVNINKTVDAITKAVEQAEQLSGIRIKGVNVGISGEHVQCIKSNAEITINPSGIVREDDVRRFVDKAKNNLINLINLEREIIHSIPQEFIIDDQEGVIDPIGMVGQTMKGAVYVVVGMKNKIRNIEQCIEKAGLVINGMTFEPIASGLAVLKESEKKSGVAIIDIGGGTSDIAIYTKGVIRHSEVIKLAAFDVTNDIAYGLKTLDYVAEDLKIKYGFAYSRDLIRDEEIHVQSIEGRAPKMFMRSQLTNIIEARLIEIFEHSVKVLKKSDYYDYLNAGAILTGGGSMIDGTQALAQEILGMDVRIGKPEGISGGMLGEINSPIYATAVGLVLRALEEIEQNPIRAENSLLSEERAATEVPKEIPKENDNSLVNRLKNWFDQI